MGREEGRKKGGASPPLRQGCVVSKRQIDAETAHYEIGSLDAGYAMALGNALRRVLLSSLPGAALISVQVAGVLHEFQPIPHVAEDMTDLAWNLKQVRLRCYTDHPVKLLLDVWGPWDARAADIVGPETVEIVNPDLHLATLDNEHAHLRMELFVQNGRGFVTADQQAEHTVEASPIGVILLDAVYSPIRKVNLTVKPQYRGRRDQTDTIGLEITTDGTITPDEALRESAAILERQFAVFADYRHQDEAQVWKKLTSSEVPIPQHIYTMSIDELKLSARSANVLRRHGIMKVGLLLEMDREELMLIRNFGDKTLQEIIECLHILQCFPEIETRAS